MLWKGEDAKPGDDLPARLPLGAQRLFSSGAEARAERCRRCRLLLFLPSCATACGVSPNQIPGSCWANTNTRSATFVVSKQRATSQQNPGGLSKPICCRVPQAVPGTGLERPYRRQQQALTARAGAQHRKPFKLPLLPKKLLKIAPSNRNRYRRVGATSAGRGVFPQPCCWGL